MPVTGHSPQTSGPAGDPVGVSCQSVAALRGTVVFITALAHSARHWAGGGWFYFSFREARLSPVRPWAWASLRDCRAHGLPGNAQRLSVPQEARQVHATAHPAVRSSLHGVCRVSYRHLLQIPDPV